MKRTTRSCPQRWPHKPKLQFEQLEDRSLLAVAAFTVNLYHDVGGVPGELIVDDTVSVGDSFFVEIMAREYHPLAAGLRGVALDIAWDPGVLAVIDEPFDPGEIVTPDLPVFVTGELHQELGRIQDLGGSAFLSSNVGRAIGNLAPERFALLNFRALQPADDSLLKMRQGGSRIVTVPTQTLRSAALYFEPQTITVLPGVTVSEESIVHPALMFEETPPEVTGDPGGMHDPPPILESPGESSVTVSEPDLPEITEILAVAPQPCSEADMLAGLPQPQATDTDASAPEIPLDPLAESSSDSRAGANNGPAHSPGDKWRNPQNPADVDGTGRVRPLDVLIIANHLNVNFGNWELPPRQFAPPRYLDVNGDGRATPHDALLVVNYIESQKTPEAEGEAAAFHASELSETVPVSERPDHVEAALRDAVFSLGSLQAAPRDGVSHRTDRPVSERPDHVEAAVRDAGRIAVFGRNAESEPQEALASGRSAADTALRARRVFLASWSEIEDILPILTADWLRRA